MDYKYLIIWCGFLHSIIFNLVDFFFVETLINAYTDSSEAKSAVKIIVSILNILSVFIIDAYCAVDTGTIAVQMVQGIEVAMMHIISIFGISHHCIIALFVMTRGVSVHKSVLFNYLGRSNMYIVDVMGYLSAAAASFAWTTGGQSHYLLAAMATTCAILTIASLLACGYRINTRVDGGGIVITKLDRYPLYSACSVLYLSAEGLDRENAQRYTRKLGPGIISSVLNAAIYLSCAAWILVLKMRINAETGWERLVVAVITNFIALLGRILWFFIQQDIFVCNAQHSTKIILFLVQAIIGGAGSNLIPTLNMFLLCSDYSFKNKIFIKALSLYGHSIVIASFNFKHIKINGASTAFGCFFILSAILIIAYIFKFDWDIVLG